MTICFCGFLARDDNLLCGWLRFVLPTSQKRDVGHPGYPTQAKLGWGVGIWNLFCRGTVAIPQEVDTRDIKERLSLFWLFALLNYLYADVLALWDVVGSLNVADAAHPHLPPWALAGSAVLMEIPMAMIVACRLLPFRANRLANIVAGIILTLVNGVLTFVPPFFGARTPALPEYLFFATIETVCTSVIIWRAWTWSPGNGETRTS